jgi:membrane protease YdiL (CAAX protease family)
MAPAVIALGLGLGLVGTVIVDVIGSAAGASTSNPPPAVNIVSDIVFDLGFVGAALYLAAQSGPLRASDFGFRFTGLRLGVSAFALGALSYYVLTDIYAHVVKLSGTDKLPSGLGVHKSTAALIAAAAFVCVIAPIAEEFFFRGFLFGVLQRWRIVVAGREIGTWLAAVVVGILFGLAHTGSASPQYLVPLGFLGFVLCIMRWRTASLYPCIALHSVNNSVALGVNELSWNAAAIAGLMAASLAIVAAITVPLAPRTARFS